MWTYLSKTDLRFRGPAVLVLVVVLAGCVTGQYRPLSDAGTTEVEQLKGNVYRVGYRTNVFTSQKQLDLYLRRRCAELALREGYEFFHLAQRADVVRFSRRTAMTVTMYTDHTPVGMTDVYDAKAVLAEAATVLQTN
jgi:hypothetical protein